MKILIIFYSRTGTTKKVAQSLAQKLNCEAEEIFDTKKRQGGWGYLMAGRDAIQKKLTTLKEIRNKPADFDLVILGTPNWAGNVCTPIRTYLWQYGKDIKQTAFFCTCGGSAGKSFTAMEKLCGLKPQATLELKTKEVWQNHYEEKLNQFVQILNK